MTSDHELLDARDAARFVVLNPLVLAERDPEMFIMIRRHETLLDRWFTQRFGYRLQVEADTARLVKTSVVARRRPLRTTTSSARPFSHREYVVLALALSSIVAGPSVISLRDLVLKIMSAATNAEVPYGEEVADRRALVTVLRWLIEHGAISELHDRIDRYAGDDDADAVLQIRADRVSMLALPNLHGAESVADVFDRSVRREQSRQWMRSLLLEEPVLYRDDVTADEWSELRRRLSEESNWFDEMFGVEIEARAEGIAVIDPDGQLSDTRFPATGTVGHASLLLIDRLYGTDDDEFDRDTLIEHVAALAERYRKFWSVLADDPPALVDAIVTMLADHRLIKQTEPARFQILPAAWRYRAEVTEVLVQQQELFT